MMSFVMPTLWCTTKGQLWCTTKGQLWCTTKILWCRCCKVDLFKVMPCVILFLRLSVLLALRLPRLGKRANLSASICACLVLSVTSSPWCLGRAAAFDCGTPWTFLLPVLLEYLTDNICVEFGGRIFKQRIDIPVGNNYAPLLSDIFLHSYEVEFIQGLMKAGKNISRSNSIYLQIQRWCIYFEFFKVFSVPWIHLTT